MTQAAILKRDLLLFQSLQRGNLEIADVREDYKLTEPAQFKASVYSKLQFVERRYSHDATNWWLPKKARTAAMSRSSGFTIESQPKNVVYVCHWKPVAAPADGSHAVYPAGGRR